MEASVVMPVHPYTDDTRRQVQALSQQDTKRNWELILSGDAENREKALPDLEDLGIPARWVTVPKGCGEPQARNKGAEAARSDIILACDSDDLVSKSWVENMLRGFDDKEVDAVGGHIEEDLLNEPRSHHLRYPFTPGRLPVVLGLYPRAVGANFGVRKRVWDELGGFDESFTWSCDTEFFMRLQANGHRLAYRGDAVVHYRHGTIEESIRKVYHWNRTRPRLYRKYRPYGAKREADWMRKWAGMILSSWRMLGGKESRLRFYGNFLRRWGHLVGSIQYRTWYP